MDELTTDDIVDKLEEEDDFQRPTRNSGSILRTLIEFAIALGIAMGLTWALKTYVIEPYEVPTGSMESTIMIGDKLLAEKISLYFNPVQPGDIVVFADVVLQGRVLVKRVIAVGGQTIDLVDGHVVIDGARLYEPYLHGVSTNPLGVHFEGMQIDYPYTVPDGYLWVMGDNRGNSADSRYFGPVLESSVYGRAFMVFWPLPDIGPL